MTLLLSALMPTARFVCVEAQAVSADLARRNVVLNGLTGRVEVVEGDLREFEPDRSFDLVTGTPPFMPLGSGILPRDGQRAAARFELRGGIEGYVTTAARAVSDLGAVAMLMDASQDARCRAAFERSGLHLQSVLTVVPRAGQPPRYRGYVGTRARGDAAERTIVVRDSDGTLSVQYQALRRTLRLES